MMVINNNIATNYCIELSTRNVLNCYDFAIAGFCLASMANSPITSMISIKKSKQMRVYEMDHVVYLIALSEIQVQEEIITKYN